MNLVEKQADCRRRAPCGSLAQPAPGHKEEEDEAGCSAGPEFRPALHDSLNNLYLPTLFFGRKTDDLDNGKGHAAVWKLLDMLL